MELYEKKVINDNYSDYELLQILENNEYEPTLENLEILKEGLDSGEYGLLDEANAAVKKYNYLTKKGLDSTAARRISGANKAEIAANNYGKAEAYRKATEDPSIAHKNVTPDYIAHGIEAKKRAIYLKNIDKSKRKVKAELTKPDTGNHGTSEAEYGEYGRKPHSDDAARDTARKNYLTDRFRNLNKYKRVKKGDTKYDDTKEQDTAEYEKEKSKKDGVSEKNAYKLYLKKVKADDQVINHRNDKLAKKIENERKNK